MKIDRYNPGHWLLLIQQGLYTLLVIALRWLPRRAGRPLIALYGHQLSGNLRALYDGWTGSQRDRIDLRVLTLDPQYAAQLRRDGVPVLQCNRLTDMLQLRRCAALITDHGLHAMTPLLRFTDIRFIDVWHGIPFKGFTPDDFRLQHRYDEVWVSSPVLRELYITRFGFSPGQVLDLGYARTDRLFARPAPASRYRAQLKLPTGHKVVLYAPTWQQDDAGRELFPFGEPQARFIATLGAACRAHGATLVIRSHLNAQIANQGDAAVQYCPQRDVPDTEDVLLGADVLICDWSSIAFDYLALDRPTLFLDVPPPFRAGFSLGPEYRFGAVVGDMAALDGTLRQCLADASDYARRYGDRHREITQQVYGENTDSRAAARQWAHLLAVLADPARDAAGDGGQ